MLIWINGAFGAGKTSVADELCRRIPAARLYDPERVGYFLRGMVPPSPTEDFQDLPIWRTMVSDIALALQRHYPETHVTPMTLVNPQYFREIIDPLRQAGVDVRPFTLDVSTEVLRRRITDQVLNPDDPEDDKRIRQWRLDQIDRCVAGLATQDLGQPIDNNGRPLDDVVAEIMVQITD